MYINNLDYDKARGNHMVTTRIIKLCVKYVADSFIT